MSKKEPIWGRREERLFQAEGTICIRAFGKREYADPWWLERPVLLHGTMGWGNQGQTIPSPVHSSLVLLKALGGHKGITAVMVVVVEDVYLVVTRPGFWKDHSGIKMEHSSGAGGYSVYAEVGVRLLQPRRMEMLSSTEDPTPLV